MSAKELLALLRFIVDQYGDGIEILMDYQDEAMMLNGGFRVDGPSDKPTAVVLL